MLKLLEQDIEKTCDENDIYENLLSLDGKEILELGCGKAEATRLIATTGHDRRITATEVDEIQHKRNVSSNDLVNVAFVLAGSESLPFANESFDIVLLFKSLHHVPTELLGTAIKEINRVLRPGGFVYISEPLFQGEFNDILRLFHDEEIVRAEAFRAVKTCVERGSFALVEELFFNTRKTFRSFEEFENDVIHVTHSPHDLTEELHARVKERFLSHLKADGVHFLTPSRVDLLKKIL